jgi:Ribbon-helix-helix protein, copG family
VRTTVTLDDDLAELLRRRARERDVPFKDVLNEAIRVGLVGGTPASKPYRMKPRELGVRPGVDLTKALTLATDLEDAEIARKLEQGR